MEIANVPWLCVHRKTRNFINVKELESSVWVFHKLNCHSRALVLTLFFFFAFAFWSSFIWIKSYDIKPSAGYHTLNLKTALLLLLGLLEWLLVLMEEDDCVQIPDSSWMILNRKCSGHASFTVYCILGESNAVIKRSLFHHSNIL